MAQMARFAMEFCAVESCGKCTPCRIGSTRGVEIMDRIVAARDVSPVEMEQAGSGYLGEALYSRAPSRIDISIGGQTALLRDLRSEERRVGKECGRTGRSRWSPDY